MNKRYGDVFSIDTYSYTMNCTVMSCLNRLANIGFRDFELQMFPGHLWPAEIDTSGRRELRRWLDDNGLSIVTLNMPNIDLNITAATSEMREMTLGILRKIVMLAGDLRVPAVILGPGKVNPLLPMPREQLIDLFYRALDILVPLASDCGTEILIENMPFAFLPEASSLLQALDNYPGKPDIGVVYDVANGYFISEDIGAAMRACQPRLRHVHLSDTHRASFQHAAIGTGSVDFSLVPGLLKELGFSGKPILEIISPQPDEAIERSAAKLIELGF